MHDDRIQPGYPEYERELDLTKIEMAIDGAPREAINAWEAATREAGTAVMSRHTRDKRAESNNTNLSTKTFCDNLGIDYWKEVDYLKKFEFGNVASAATTATTNSTATYFVTTATTSTCNFSINTSGNGFIVAYEEYEPAPEKKAKQWRGEVSGRVRFK